MTTALVHVGALPALDAFTPCDACGHRSYVLVRLLSDKILSFCGHHYAAHALALLPLVHAVRDDRHLLSENRLQGSDH